MNSAPHTDSVSSCRRNLIKLAAVGSADASALSAVATPVAQDSAVRLLQNDPGPSDFVILGGLCVDPSPKLSSSNDSHRYSCCRRILQATSGYAAITVGQPWRDEAPKSRIVFIGSRGGVNSSEIDALFHKHANKQTNLQDQS